VIGTAGILLRAKARGLIPAVRPLLLELKAKGYHLQSQLIDQISAAAGE
jgi:predicted nucleic acid-binding protein